MFRHKEREASTLGCTEITKRSSFCFFVYFIANRGKKFFDFLLKFFDDFINEDLRATALDDFMIKFPEKSISLCSLIILVDA